MATGGTEDGMINTTNWNVSQGWAAGGNAMTAAELATYGEGLAAGKLFKNPDTLAEMLTFNPNAMNGLMGYGLGLLDFSKVGAPGSWGHEGQTAGFQSLWYTNPETGVTVVGLTNSAAYSAYAFLNVAGLLAPEASGSDRGRRGRSGVTDGAPLAVDRLHRRDGGVQSGNTRELPLTFNEDGTVNIVADCNNAAGSYTAEDGALTIAIGPDDDGGLSAGVAQRPVREAAGRGRPVLLRGRPAFHRPDGRRRHDGLCPGRRSGRSQRASARRSAALRAAGRVLRPTAGGPHGRSRHGLRLRGRAGIAQRCERPRGEAGLHAPQLRPRRPTARPCSCWPAARARPRSAPSSSACSSPSCWAASWLSVTSCLSSSAARSTPIPS